MRAKTEAFIWTFIFTYRHAHALSEDPVRWHNMAACFISKRHILRSVCELLFISCLVTTHASLFVLSAWIDWGASRGRTNALEIHGVTMRWVGSWMTRPEEYNTSFTGDQCSLTLMGRGVSSFSAREL